MDPAGDAFAQRHNQVHCEPIDGPYSLVLVVSKTTGHQFLNSLQKGNWTLEVLEDVSSLIHEASVLTVVESRAFIVTQGRSLLEVTCELLTDPAIMQLARVTSHGVNGC